MKQIILIHIICLLQNFVLSQESDSSSSIRNVHDIFLEETTLKQLKENYPNCRVEKPRYARRIVYIDSLGIKIYLQKEKFKHEYTAYNIILNENCPYKLIGGIGIGSTYDEIAEVFPSILTDHSSRLTGISSNQKTISLISIYQDSSQLTFYADGSVKAPNFIVNQISLSHSNYTDPFRRSTLAFMGLPSAEFSSDFNSYSVFGGYGFYTTYFVTGKLGAEFRFSNDSFLLGPKATLGFCIPGFPGGQFSFSTYVPINNQSYDIILNPKIGISYLLGVFYFEFGYLHNVTRNFEIPSSINLTLGVQIPLNISKFVSNF